MRQAVTPARDLADARVRVLAMLREGLDARWTNDWREEGADVWSSAETAILGEIAALLGASKEEIAAQDQHTFCPSHNAHACDGCTFACTHCWKDYPTWKAKA